MLPPRLVVAGTASGVGKTTVATGLMAALARRGVRVGAAKVGPDFIDPGYHSLATGRPGRNLDAWMCGEGRIPGLAAAACRGADVLIVEGVMGLFDGAAEGGEQAGLGSTAHVARLLRAPILLVVDASSLSASVAAVVHGFASFDDRVKVGGVVLNRVGSDGHETLLREALAPLGVAVFGALRRDGRLAWRSRHLGLVPVVEAPEGVERSISLLADAVERWCDVEGLAALAASASRSVPAVEAVEAVEATEDDPAPGGAVPHDVPAGGRVRLAVAGGPAFSFVYPDNLEALERAGAELAPFDPLQAPRLPEGCQALYAGGGFPEVFAGELAANIPLLESVREEVRRGLVVLAECGGLLWLASSLDGREMAGVLPARGRMTGRLTLGYRRVLARRDTPVLAAGRSARGHEFHYSEVEPTGDALELTGRFGRGPGGFGGERMLASYVHLHFGSDPALARRLVDTARAVGSATRRLSHPA